MLKKMKNIRFNSMLGALLALSPIVSAEPFSVTYQGLTAGAGATTLANGAIDGQRLSVTLVVDNGLSSRLSQSWTADDFECVIFAFNEPNNIWALRDPDNYGPYGLKVFSTELAPGNIAVANGATALATDENGFLTGPPPQVSGSVVDAQATHNFDAPPASWDWSIPEGTSAEIDYLLLATGVDNSKRYLSDSESSNGPDYVRGWSQPKPFRGTCADPDGDGLTVGVDSAPFDRDEDGRPDAVDLDANGDGNGDQLARELFPEWSVGGELYETYYVSSFSLSGNGSRLAVARGDIAEMMVIDLTDGDSQTLVGGAINFVCPDPVNVGGETSRTRCVAGDANALSLGTDDVVSFGNDDDYGGQVDLSEDGSTLVVSAEVESSDEFRGRAYVYEWDGSNWSGVTLAPSDGEVLSGLPSGTTTGEDEFAGNVAVSADGNTIAIGVSGARNDEFTANNRAGHVYLYRKDATSGNWNIAAKFEDLEWTAVTNRNGFGLFGARLSLSADGARLAVAGRRVFDHGAVYLYNTVTQERIFREVNDGSGDLGSSVSLSADGTTLVVADDRDEFVQIYRVDQSTLEVSLQQTLREAAHKASNREEFATKAAVSGDGQIVAVTATPSIDDNAYASIFMRQQDGNYKEIESIETTGYYDASTGDGDSNEYWGYSLDLSDDGSALLLGDPYVGFYMAYGLSQEPNNYLDSDGDGLDDAVDPDDDNDGVPDDSDAFPLDANENTDTDNDGVGNNADTDDDDDGLADDVEVGLGTNPLIADTDGDGYDDGEEQSEGSSPTDVNDVPLAGINISILKAAIDAASAANTGATP